MSRSSPLGRIERGTPEWARPRPYNRQNLIRKTQQQRKTQVLVGGRIAPLSSQVGLIDYNVPNGSLLESRDGRSHAWTGSSKASCGSARYAGQ